MLKTSTRHVRFIQFRVLRSSRSVLAWHVVRVPWRSAQALVHPPGGFPRPRTSSQAGFRQVEASTTSRSSGSFNCFARGSFRIRGMLIEGFIATRSGVPAHCPVGRSESCATDGTNQKQEALQPHSEPIIPSSKTHSTPTEKPPSRPHIYNTPLVSNSEPT